MSALLSVLTLGTWAHSRTALQLEILALRHQLQVWQRTRPARLRLSKTDRCLWVMLARIWKEWRTALVLVQPETVIAWYGAYYEQSRTHLSLAKDAPIPRPIAAPTGGRVVAIPQVGGLHHRYERRAA